MKQITNTLLDSLTREAQGSPRKRAHYNLHPRLDDPVQRLCVAIEPETYIRPHRHAEPETSEIFIMLRGSAVVLYFDDTGRITETITVSVRGPVRVIEIPAAAWHAIASLESGTVFFEVKQGPYVQPKEKNVAPWSPAEGQPGTEAFVEWYTSAEEGGTPPVLRQ